MWTLREREDVEWCSGFWFEHQAADRRKSSVPMTSWKQRRERGDTTEYQDRAMIWMEQNVLKETQGQLHGCSTCPVSPSPTHWRALCLVQCSASHLEVYNDFIHELRFCEWRWIGQWSLPVSRADLCNMCVLHSSLPLSHRAFGIPQEHWIPVDTTCGSSVPLKVSISVLRKLGALSLTEHQNSIQGWLPWKAVLSIPINLL